MTAELNPTIEGVLKSHNLRIADNTNGFIILESNVILQWLSKPVIHPSTNKDELTYARFEYLIPFPSKVVATIVEAFDANGNKLQMPLIMPLRSYSPSLAIGQIVLICNKDVAKVNILAIGK